jgi:hypothetical protein
VVAEKPNWTWYTRYSGETAAFAANARNAMAAAAQNDGPLGSINRRDRLSRIASPNALASGSSSRRIDAGIPLLCRNQDCAEFRQNVEALRRHPLDARPPPIPAADALVFTVRDCGIAADWWTRQPAHPARLMTDPEEVLGQQHDRQGQCRRADLDPRSDCHGQTVVSCAFDAHRWLVETPTQLAALRRR